MAPALAVLVGLALNMWPNRVQCLHACHRKPVHLDREAAKGVDFCEFRSTNFSKQDFVEKGVSIVHGFLSEEEVAKLIEIWWNTPDLNSPGKNGGSTPGYRIPDKIDMFHEIPTLYEKIKNLKELIEDSTDIRTCKKGSRLTYNNLEVQMTGQLFHTSANKTGSMNFPWHQDIECYYQSDDLYNWLSFYVMLEKPHRNEAGIGVVPYDGLKARAPEMYKLTYGCRHERGCNFVHPGEWGDYLVDANSDRPVFMDFRVEEVGCYPELGPGDLAVFRGDVIHRTQPHNSYRTSLNVVVRPGLNYLRLEDQMRGGHRKYSWMAMHPQGYVGYHPGREAEFYSKLYWGSMYRNVLWPIRHSIDFGTDKFEMELFS